MKQLDHVDRRILAILQEDASIAVAEIGARVGLSQTPCWRRIQRLREDGVIEATVALVKPEAVGCGLTVFMAIEARDHSPQWLEQFTEMVVARSEVLDVHRMAGEMDYLLRVAVPDMAAYDQFYRELIAAVPLKNVSSHFAMERVKSSTAYPVAAA
ncbi:MAG TPA: Lrp/AsnC family transcriptional regulator [Sphingomicrobium sp.]|jgi:Lrp/AsnC family transcriptional regulator|nr:Lrp/AsnC family transcriptional regulator [Sphingomicrobium sp.]